ncbi:MAG: 2-amino-5-chloromuconate deaminase CnbZ [Acidobacteriota bacterium]
MLVENPKGNYHFLKGSSAYSSGVVAALGYEIVQVTLNSLLSFQSGFDLMARHLASAGRPMQAVCAMELCSPRPFSFEGFAEFNHGYHAVLADAEILVDTLNPVARTNVAPEVDPPAEPSLHAFSYTVPHPGSKVRPTFVVAGAGELVESRLNPQSIVRPNEVSADAMREKAAHVMRCMTGRLRGLGVSWDEVNVVNIYTVHDVFPFFQEEVLAVAGAGVRHGVRLHYARPPIAGLDYEMDVRGVRTELYLG